mmetsp:Transcript_13467/g.20804  ORF Transcript_13467/g.20804 Transcript_13467/m.20804 type:complete len:1191 (+) Transcript_13467:1954-5526(+)
MEIFLGGALSLAGSLQLGLGSGKFTLSITQVLSSFLVASFKLTDLLLSGSQLSAEITLGLLILLLVLAQLLQVSLQLVHFRGEVGDLFILVLLGGLQRSATRGLISVLVSQFLDLGFDSLASIDFFVVLVFLLRESLLQVGELQFGLAEVALSLLLLRGHVSKIIFDVLNLAVLLPELALELRLGTLLTFEVAAQIVDLCLEVLQVLGEDLFFLSSGRQRGHGLLKLLLELLDLLLGGVVGNLLVLELLLEGSNLVLELLDNLLEGSLVLLLVLEQLLSVAQIVLDLLLLFLNTLDVRVSSLEVGLQASNFVGLGLQLALHSSNLGFLFSETRVHIVELDFKVLGFSRQAVALSYQIRNLGLDVFQFGLKRANGALTLGLDVFEILDIHLQVLNFELELLVALLGLSSPNITISNLVAQRLILLLQPLVLFLSLLSQKSLFQNAGLEVLGGLELLLQFFLDGGVFVGHGFLLITELLKGTLEVLDLALQFLDSGLVIIGLVEHLSVLSFNLLQLYLQVAQLSRHVVTGIRKILLGSLQITELRRQSIALSGGLVQLLFKRKNLFVKFLLQLSQIVVDLHLILEFLIHSLHFAAEGVKLLLQGCPLGIGVLVLLGLSVELLLQIGQVVLNLVEAGGKIVMLLGFGLQVLGEGSNLLLSFQDLVLVLALFKKRTDLHEELPPSPITEVKERTAVLLDNLSSGGLELELLVHAASSVTTASSLDSDNQSANLLLAGGFDASKLTSTEENLCHTEAVQIVNFLELSAASGIDDLLGNELLDQQLDISLGVGAVAVDLGSKEMVALQKVGIQHSVGETHTGNTDTLQHTIVAKLLLDDRSNQFTGPLLVIGQDTTHKVRLSGTKDLHEVGQLGVILLGDELELSTSSTTVGSTAEVGVAATTRRTTGAGASLSRARGTLSISHELIAEHLKDEAILGGLEALEEILLHGILVLQHPVSGIVLDFSGIVLQEENILFEHFGARPLGGVLVVEVHLLHEGVIGTVGEETLLVQNLEDTVGRTRDQINSHLRIDTEVHELPLDLFALVFFLLQLEHVVVEELLEPFVGVIDAKLLEAVLLENLETSNIQHTDEGRGIRASQNLVHSVDNPQETTVVDLLGEGITRVNGLLFGQVGSNKLFGPSGTDLNTGLQECLLENLRVNGEHLGGVAQIDLGGHGGHVVGGGTVLDVTEMQDTSD